MMKKMLVLGAVAAVALVMSGCSSVQTATNFNGQKVVASGEAISHVSTQNCGLYLLWIPLITGSAETANSPAFIKDDVNAPAMVDMLTRTAKEQGAKKVLDITSTTSSGGFIFYWKSAYASGTAVK